MASQTTEKLTPEQRKAILATLDGEQRQALLEMKDDVSYHLSMALDILDGEA